MANHNPELLKQTSADVRDADCSASKSFSCVLCAQRKVKCDRRASGCRNCGKSRVPCIYKTPPAPRRRKKGVRDVDITTRLRLYEDALRELGVEPDSLLNQNLSSNLANDPAPVSSDMRELRDIGQTRKVEPLGEVGVLVFEDGKSRYLENGIWTSFKGEFRESKEILDEGSDEEPPAPEFGPTWTGAGPNNETILFGLSSLPVLGHLHPAPVQIFQLWQLYLDNINPLVKPFHAPTVQQIISDASGHLEDLPRNVEALLFAVYCVTISSLSDGDCIGLLGLNKEMLTKQFRAAAQCAFSNASLLRTSDIMVLQAFVLFILSLQNYDARVIWHYTGIAQRIGQRIGLHCDAEKLKLPPFDVEIRRRLWWQIMMLEGYAQKLVGTEGTSTILMGDVRMPANVNDSDICPSMESPPREHAGATEMMFFLIRCHVGTFLMGIADPHTALDRVWHGISTDVVPVAIKDKAVSELEELFKDKFLQYCDPSIPWHFMCIQLGQAIIFMMRFMAHSTEYHRLDADQTKKDELFRLALQVISAQNLAYTMKDMQGFMWHVNLHFQWKAFIYLVGELRHRTSGEDVEIAWKEIAKTYEFHPSFDKELSRRALPVAVSALTLKAWESYVSTSRRNSGGREPYFIQIIRRNGVQKTGSTNLRRADHSKERGTSSEADYLKRGEVTTPSIVRQAELFQVSEGEAPEGTRGVDSISTFDGLQGSDNHEEMDWSSWDNLVVDFQAHNGDDLLGGLNSFDFDLLQFSQG